MLSVLFGLEASPGQTTLCLALERLEGPAKHALTTLPCAKMCLGLGQTWCVSRWRGHVCAEMSWRPAVYGALAHSKTGSTHLDGFRGKLRFPRGAGAPPVVWRAILAVQALAFKSAELYQVLPWKRTDLWWVAHVSAASHRVIPVPQSVPAGSKGCVARTSVE